MSLVSSVYRFCTYSRVDRTSKFALAKRHERPTSEPVRFSLKFQTLTFNATFHTVPTDNMCNFAMSLSIGRS